MVGWTLGMLLSVGAVYAAWRRLRHAHLALRFDMTELARYLEKHPTQERLRVMARAASRSGPSWEASLLEELVTAGDEQTRIAIANEHLSDLRAELDWGRTIPRSAARIGLLGPLCIGFFMLGGGASTAADLLPVLAWCLVGGFGPMWVGRAARDVVNSLRASADVFVERSMQAARQWRPSENPVKST